MKDFNVTKRIKNKDFDSLRKKIEDLEKLRAEIIERRSFVDGDRSENADWIVLTEEFENVSREIEKIRKTLFEITELIPDQDNFNEYIDIGCKVVYEILGKEDQGTHEIEITHEAVTDPFKNKISCKSPLGSSLKFKRVNDIVDVIGLGYKVRVLQIR